MSATFLAQVPCGDGISDALTDCYGRLPAAGIFAVAAIAAVGLAVGLAITVFPVLKELGSQFANYVASQLGGTSGIPSGPAPGPAQAGPQPPVPQAGLPQAGPPRPGPPQSGSSRFGGRTYVNPRTGSLEVEFEDTTLNPVPPNEWVPGTQAPNSGSTRSGTQADEIAAETHASYKYRGHNVEAPEVRNNRTVDPQTGEVVETPSNSSKWNHRARLLLDLLNAVVGHGK